MAATLWSKLHVPIKTEIGGYHSKTTCVGFLSHLANNVHLHTMLGPQYPTNIIKFPHPFRSTSVSHRSCQPAQSYLKNFDPCLGSIYLLQPYTVMVCSASQSASHPALIRKLVPELIGLHFQCPFPTLCQVHGVFSTGPYKRPHQTFLWYL